MGRLRADGLPRPLAVLIARLNSQVPAEQVTVLAQGLLLDLFGFDSATFDQKWREWVPESYPKK